VVERSPRVVDSTTIGINADTTRLLR